MPPDVVTVYFLEDPSRFKPPVDCLVARLDAGLPPFVLDGMHGVVQALNLVGGANIAIVGLDTFAQLEEVTKDLVEDLDFSELPAG